VGVVAGAVLGYGLPALGGPVAALAVIVAGSALVVWGVYCGRARRRAPERYRAYVAEHLDAAAGPPAGAVPVEEPVLTRWCESGDPDLLADDFRYVAPDRDWSRRRYVRATRIADAWLPSTSRLEEVVADPSGSGELWMRQSSVIRPPNGSAEIRIAAWHRCTLTPDRRRIRRLELVAFAEPFVHA
jgi:hypothetical protein